MFGKSSEMSLKRVKSPSLNKLYFYNTEDCPVNNKMLLFAFLECTRQMKFIYLVE